MFAIAAFGYLFGFVGLHIAVPLAASIGRVACDCYPAICPRSASAPLIETIFSPGATPLTVRSTCCAQRPRATAFSAPPGEVEAACNP
jgi:hypothetical protein